MTVVGGAAVHTAGTDAAGTKPPGGDVEEAGTSRSGVPVGHRSGHGRRLRPTRSGWPVWAFTAGMPLAFLVGVHGFVWCLPGLVFGARIVADRTARIPPSSILLAAFLGWALLALSVLSSSKELLLFGYRWLVFAGAFTCLVWLVNVPERTMPTNQIVDWMAALWITLVVLGIGGILLPNLNTASPFGLLLGSIGKMGFVKDLSDWRLAETQGFLGYPLPRPAAPFGATNGWGAAMGVLTPFFIQSWIVEAGPARRRKGMIIGLVGVYPILISVNRGLWISLAVGLAYFAARKALRGRFGPFLVLIGALVTVTALLIATPAGGLVTDKLDKSGQSNDTRSTLYHLAFQGAVDQPLVGHGAPSYAPGLPKGTPPIGTHGLIWYLMYVNGFVGLVLFVGWLGVEVLRSGRVRTASGWWAHLSLVIALVEVPFYGLLPQVVLFGVAAGISHRDLRQPTDDPRSIDR